MASDYLVLKLERLLSPSELQMANECATQVTQEEFKRKEYGPPKSNYQMCLGFVLGQKVSAAGVKQATPKGVHTPAKYFTDQIEQRTEQAVNINENFRFKSLWNSHTRKMNSVQLYDWLAMQTMASNEEDPIKKFQLQPWLELTIQVQQVDGTWVDRDVNTMDFILNEKGDFKFDKYLDSPAKRAEFLEDIRSIAPTFHPGVTNAFDEDGEKAKFKELLPYVLGIGPREDALSVHVDRNTKFIVNSNASETPHRWEHLLQFKQPLLAHDDTIVVKVRMREGAWVERGVTADEFVFNNNGEFKFDDHLTTPYQRARFLADFIPCFPKYQTNTDVRKLLSQGVEGFLRVSDLCK